MGGDMDAKLEVDKRIADLQNEALLSKSAKEDYLKIDVKGLSPGIYFTIIVTNGKSYFGKLLKE